MQRLEITGNTPEEFYLNVINTLSLILRGSAQTTAAPVATTEEIMPSANEIKGVASVSTVEEINPEPPAPKKRGPKPKTAEPARTELNDDISDLGGAPAKELTLDGDIKPRLQAISAACTKRGMSMPDTVAYIQKLYAPFGIAKAPQLKPGQFEEFMEASEAYLDGTAEA